MIELSNVTKRFGSGRVSVYTAVDDVSLVVDCGLLTILKGPSGSGKTTLLSIIGCMSRPTSGRVTLSGLKTNGLAGGAAGGFPDTMDVSGLPERFLTGIRRTAFGFIFQHFGLVKGISAEENIMLPAYPTGESRGSIRKRAAGLMEEFGIMKRADARVEWLSGGELQRVAIARALINNPEVIIADEPTAHLDSRLSSEFMDMVGRLKSEGKTIIIASHDPIVYDSPLAEAVVEMRDGRITGMEKKG